MKTSTIKTDRLALKRGPTMKLRHLLCAVVGVALLLCASTGWAATFNATTSGNWNLGVTWGNAGNDVEGSGYPGASDTANIPTTINVTNTATASAANLAVATTGKCQNEGALTVGTLLSGTGSLVQGAGATLNLSGSSPTITTLTAIASGNSVNYTGAAQTLKGTAYYHLGLSGSGVKTMTGVSGIGGNMTLGGTATATAVALTVGGNLDVGSGTTFTVPNVVFTVSGTTTVGGTLTHSSATGAKTYTGDVAINVGGNWNETAGPAITFGGNLQNDGTFTAGAGTHSFTGASKTIGGANSISIGNVTVNGSYQNDGTLTVGTALAGSGTLTQGTGATLNIGGTSATFTLVATASGNTVNYNGTVAQTVKAVSYENLLISGSNTKTLGGTVGVAGDLTVSGGTLDLSTFAANRTSAGGTLTLGAGTTLRIGGTGTLPSNYATHSLSATSTIEYFGTTQSVATLNSSQNYGNLTISGTLTKTLAGNIVIAGNLTNSGTLDLTSFTADRATSGGVLSLATGSMLKIGGTGTLPANFSTHVLNAASTVEYSGSAQIVSAETYGNLTASGSGTKTLASGTTSVGGILTIGTGTTLDAGANNFSLTGNWVNNGSFTASGSQTVTFNAGSATIGGSAATTFNNLTVSGSGTKTAAANFAVASVFTIGTGATFNGSTFTITLSGSGTPLVVTGTYTVATSTIKYTSATGASVTGTSYYSLTLDSSGQTFTAAGDMAVSKVLTVASGTSFDGSTRTITLTDLTAGATPFVVSGTFVPSTSTVFYSNTTAIADNVAGVGYYNLTVNGNGSGDTFTAIGNITIANVFTVSVLAGDATFNASSFTLTLTGSGTPLVVNGTFTPATSTVRYTGVSGANVSGTTYNNLTLDSSGQTFTAAGNMAVASVLTVAGGTTLDASSRSITLSGSGTPLVVSGTLTPSTSTVTYTSATGATVSGTTYNNLTINGTGTFLAAANLIIAGNLTNLAGTLDLGAFTADRTASGGTLTLANAAAAILKIGGTGTFPANYASHVIGAASTVDYSGTTQIVAALNNSTNYGNLTLSGSGTKSAAANLGVAGTFAVGTGVVFSPDAAVVLNNTTTQGTLTGSGTIQVTRTAATADLASQYKFTTRTLTGLTVDYAGTGGQTVNSTVGNYGALKTSGSGTKTLAGGIIVNGGLAIGSGTTLDVSGSNFGISVGGDWSNNGGSFTPGAGTVTFTGTGVQSISGTATSQTFNNVTLTKTAGTLLSVGGSTTALTVNNLTETSGNFTAPATLDINGTCILTAGTFTAGTDITIAGDWTKVSAAIFTPGSGTVTFDGTGAQAINGTSASQTFNHVAIAKTAGTLLSVGGSTATLTVNNLTEISGNFTGPATLTISGSASLTAGTFTAGTTVNIAGDWTNNGGTFAPGAGTVNFNSTTAAQAINGSATSQTFNNLTVAKTAQTLSVGGSTTTLTVNNFTETSGNFTAPATFDINGIATLTAGTFTSGAATTLAGNWVNNGATFTHNSGTVTFDGTATQSIGGSAVTTFNNLTIANTSATVSETVNCNVAGTMTVNAGALFSPSATVVINSAAAQGTLTGSGTIQVTRTAATADLVNQYKFTTYTLSSLAADYAGTLAQTINNTVGSYGALKTSVGGTKTLGGPVTVTGDLTIGTSTVLAAGANNLSLGGNWINNVGAGGFTSSGAQTVAFNGSTAQSIGGPPTTTFNNLEISNNSGVSVNSGINPTVSATLALTDGALSIGVNTLTLNGAISVGSGSLTGGASANITFGGTTVTTLPGVTLNNLIVARSGGIAISPTVTVNSTLTLTSGAVTSAGNLGLGNGATISRAAGSLDAAPAFGTSVNLIYTATVTTGNEVPASASVLNNLTVSGGTTTLGDLVTANGSVNLTGGNLNTSASSHSLTVVGDLSVGANTLTANGSTITIGGNFTGTGTFTSGTSTVVFNGLGTQSIPVSAGFGNFNNLTINKSSGTAMLAGAVLVNNDLTITAGELDVTASNFALSVGGNWVRSGTFTPRNGTVTFNGSSGTQTLSGDTTFYNLTVANSGATIAFGSTITTIANTLSRTAGTAMDPGTGTIVFTGAAGSIIGGSPKTFYDLQIDSGASISHSAGNLTIQGDFVNNGTFSQTATLTTTFDNTGTHNLAGSGTTTFGIVAIQGSPTVVNAGIHNFSVAGATWSITSGGTFNPGSGTVTFNGSVAQSIGGSAASQTFNNLAVNKGNTLSVAASTTNLNVNGTLTLTAGTFAAGTATGINVAGDWANNSSATAFTTGTGTVTLNGSTLQSITGSQPTTFNNLVVSNPAGASVNRSVRVGAGTVNSGALLLGVGPIAGAFTVNGTVSPGTNGIGALTLSNAPALTGTILAEINPTNAQSADKLVLTTGTLTYGGALIVTNVGPVATSGSTFTLFNSTNYAGAFASLTLPPGGTNHWKTNNLTVDGTISFTNNNPVARSVSTSVAQGGVVAISFDLGKYKLATDADGDSVKITSAFGATNANLGVAPDGLTMTYTNTGGSADTFDGFTYTVSDGVGGLATNTVAVHIEAGTGFNLLSVSGNTMTYVGIPGASYALENTATLVPATWVPVVTNVVGTDGRLVFNLDSPSGFYRTRYVSGP